MTDADERRDVGSDVAVVSVVRGRPTYIRVRGGSIPRDESAAYTSAADALVALSDWLLGRLDEATDEM